MTEELVVDPSLLETAGSKLGELVYPAPLPPLALPAADPMSAAINETLPMIESPVISALPAVKAASTRTGSSLAIAAGIYADTDQRLAEHVNQGKFGPAGGTTDISASHASASPMVATRSPRLGGATAADTDADGGQGDVPEEGTPPTPQPAPAAPLPGTNLTLEPLGSIISAAGAVSPASQNVQAVTSAIQGAIQSASAPTGASAATGAAEKAQLTDETQPDSEDAAPGEEVLQSVPVRATTGSRAPSGIEL